MCFYSDKLDEFNLEIMNAQKRQWFGTVVWVVQLLGGCFRQENWSSYFFIIWQSLTIKHVIFQNFSHEPFLRSYYETYFTPITEFVVTLGCGHSVPCNTVGIVVKG